MDTLCPVPWNQEKWGLDKSCFQIYLVCFCSSVILTINIVWKWSMFRCSIIAGNPLWTLLVQTLFWNGQSRMDVLQGCWLLELELGWNVRLGPALDCIFDPGICESGNIRWVCWFVLATDWPGTACMILELLVLCFIGWLCARNCDSSDFLNIW